MEVIEVQGVTLEVDGNLMVAVDLGVPAITLAAVINLMAVAA